MVQIGIIGKNTANAPGRQLRDSAGIVDGEDVDGDADVGKRLDEGDVDQVVLGMVGRETKLRQISW